MSCDVQDAFLTVKQRNDSCKTCCRKWTTICIRQSILPGQRAWKPIVEWRHHKSPQADIGYGRKWNFPKHVEDTRQQTLHFARCSWLVGDRSCRQGPEAVDTCSAKCLQDLVLGRTLLRVPVFGALLWPHFGVQRQSVFFRRNTLKPIFCLSQIHDKPSKSLDQIQPDITSGKDIFNPQTSVKSNVTWQNKTHKNKWKTHLKLFLDDTTPRVEICLDPVLLCIHWCINTSFQPKSLNWQNREKGYVHYLPYSKCACFSWARNTSAVYVIYQLFHW